MPMELVLLENVENLGDRGAVVKVKPGYGRNYLIPQGLALPATRGNRKLAEQHKQKVDLHLIKEREEAEALAQRLAEVSLTITKKVGETETLYGSLTAMDVAEALGQQGITVDKRRVEVPDHIKTLGVYPIPIRLHPEVTAEVKVWLVQE